MSAEEVLERWLQAGADLMRINPSTFACILRLAEAAVVDIAKESPLTEDETVH